MKKLLLLTLILFVGYSYNQISPDVLNTNHFMNIFGFHIPGTGGGTKQYPATVNKNPSTKGGLVTSTPNQNFNFGTPAPLNLNSALNSGGLQVGGSSADYNYNPYGSGYDTGGSGSTSPDTSALQNEIRSRIAAIQQAYGALQGNISPVIQDQVNQYLQNYGTQQQRLNDAFGQTTGQEQAMYGARGLGDSSFQGNALDQAANTYNTNLNALNQDKQSKLGAIGQYAQGLQSSAQNASNQYGQYLQNLGSYSPTDLQSLDAQLVGVAPQVQAQAAGLGTNQDFLNTLAQYAPAANQGVDQLTSQLGTLAKSSAPIFAKNQIAQGLIKSSQLTDPNAQSYYTDYFQKLLSGQGA